MARWCKNSAISPTYQNVIAGCHRFICVFFQFVWYFDFSRWRRKLNVFLNNQQERIGILQIVKPFFSICILKLFLNNRLVNLRNAFRLLHNVHWAQNWPIVCDVHKCKIFNRTLQNSLMNSIVFQRNGSRNELCFHNFSPCSTTHFFISLTLKKLYKMVEFVE